MPFMCFSLILNYKASQRFSTTSGKGETTSKNACQSKDERASQTSSSTRSIPHFLYICSLCVFCSTLPSMDGFLLLTYSFSLVTPAWPRPTLSLLASLLPRSATWPFPFHSHYLAFQFIREKSHSGSLQSQSHKSWAVSTEDSPLRLVPISRPIGCSWWTGIQS